MKTKPNKMNVRLLRRIQKQILKEPRQFQMESVFTDHLNVKIPHCGTAACIVGWAIAMQSKLKPRLACEILSIGGDSRIKSYNESEIFRIDGRSASRLVNFYQWPDKFKKVWIDKEGTRAFARQAVRRIDHFIKTKGAE